MSHPCYVLLGGTFIFLLTYLFAIVNIIDPERVLISQIEIVCLGY